MIAFVSSEKPVVSERRSIVFASRRDDASKSAFIEVDRHFDAKDVASRILHDLEPYVSSLLYRERVPQYPLPRWQVRWVGSAAGTPNTRCKQVRFITREDDSAKWLEMHELE